MAGKPSPIDRTSQPEEISNALDVRGFHLNLENCRRFDCESAVRFIETMGQLGLNTALVEYGSRFPFKAFPELRAADCLSRREIDRLCAAAAAAGVEIIPLQQSFAHLEYALDHPSWLSLRERSDRSNLICPSHPESLKRIEALVTEVLSAHPESRWFHIGGDEARKIGACERCRPATPERRGELAGRHLGAVARLVVAQGKRPIVWDDTFCSLPRAIAHLPSETIIHYWDYIAVADPTPVLIPRRAHDLGGPRVAHDWRWFVSGRGSLSNVQRGVMKNYSKPVRMRASLGKEFMDEFGRYLGDGFPKWIRALPYLEYYQDHGFDVLTSPTGMGNGDMVNGEPNFARFDANIRTHAARCKGNGKALGIITTAWYNVPLEMLHRSLKLTADAAG